jgi:hypothetical protein
VADAGKDALDKGNDLRAIRSSMSNSTLPCPYSCAANGPAFHITTATRLDPTAGFDPKRLKKLLCKYNKALNRGAGLI